MAWWRKGRTVRRDPGLPPRSRGPYRERAEIAVDLDWRPETALSTARDAELSAVVAPGSGEVWQPDTESDTLVIVRAVVVLAVLAAQPIVWLVMR